MTSASLSAQAVRPRLARRTYLVDARFQLRYTLLLCGLGVACSAVFGLGLWQLWRTSEADVGALGRWLAHGTRPSDDALWLTLALCAVMATSLFVFGVLFTHRVAGPAYVMRQKLRALQEGRWPSPRRLRRHDALVGLHDELTRTIDVLRTQKEKEAALIAAQLSILEAEVGQSPRGQEALKSLRALVPADAAPGQPSRDAA